MSQAFSRGTGNRQEEINFLKNEISKCRYYYSLSFLKISKQKTCQPSLRNLLNKKKGGECQNWYPIFEPWRALKIGATGEKQKHSEQL